MATPGTVGYAASCIMMNVLGVPPNRAFACAGAEKHDRRITPDRANIAFLTVCREVLSQARTKSDEQLHDLVAESIDNATKNISRWVVTLVAATYIRTRLRLRHIRSSSDYDF